MLLSLMLLAPLARAVDFVFPILDRGEAELEHVGEPDILGIPDEAALTELDRRLRRGLECLAEASPEAPLSGTVSLEVMLRVDESWKGHPTTAVDTAELVDTTLHPAVSSCVLRWLELGHFRGALPGPFLRIRWTVQLSWVPDPVPGRTRSEWVAAPPATGVESLYPLLPARVRVEIPVTMTEAQCAALDRRTCAAHPACRRGHTGPLELRPTRHAGPDEPQRHSEADGCVPVDAETIRSRAIERAFCSQTGGLWQGASDEEAGRCWCPMGDPRVDTDVAAWLERGRLRDRAGYGCIEERQACLLDGFEWMPTRALEPGESWTGWLVCSSSGERRRASDLSSAPACEGEWVVRYRCGLPAGQE